MNLHPFDDVLLTAREQMKKGNTIHLQFNCSNCGEKQTFAEENYLSIFGQCEECGHLTNLQKHGCNILVIMSGM